MIGKNILKRYIITHNIFGVDIEEGAIEIAKLRLWLAMFSEIEKDSDTIEPLPNIEYNLRCGNSLIGFRSLILDAGLNNKVDDLISGKGGVFSHQQITKCEGAANQKIDPGEEYMKKIFELMGSDYVDWTKDSRCQK